MVHFKRILLVCIVSAAVPATLAVVDGRVDGARLARVHLKIGKGYPGAMLQEYLGTNISPREWRTVLAPYEANISSCMTIEGHIYSNSVADPTPVDELRVADPEAFGKRYAYGFTVSLNAQDVQGHDPSTDGGGRLEASVEYAATLQACADRATETLADLMAPAAVHQRAGELAFEYEQSNTMREAVKDWSACMQGAGYDLDEPDAVTALLASYLATLQPEPAATEYAEEPIRLSEVDLGRLRAFEQRVFDVDQDCSAQEGLIDARYAEEAFVVETLRTEFPTFDGINYHANDAAGE